MVGTPQTAPQLHRPLGLRFSPGAPAPAVTLIQLIPYFATLAVNQTICKIFTISFLCDELSVKEAKAILFLAYK